MLDEVRSRVDVPVSTGETWDTWIAHPELADHVDFIAAHILPYWEGIPAQAAVGHAIDRYKALEKAFPGKRIVIAEFGWPSQGYNNLAAQPNVLAEAETVRAFVKAARMHQISYNVIEAFDQPWKGAEGSVGAYWGLYNFDRTPKFPMTGIVQTPHKSNAMWLAVAFGALITLFSLRRRKPLFGQAMAYSVAANALSAGVAVAALYPVENYLNLGSAIAWGDRLPVDDPADRHDAGQDRGGHGSHPWPRAAPPDPGRPLETRGQADCPRSRSISRPTRNRPRC